MRYEFQYRNVPILHKFNAIELLKGEKKVSLDLGLSKESVERKGEAFYIREIPVEKRILEKISKDKGTSIFFVFEYGIKKALFFDRNVYKLRLVKPNTAPTLEINGIHMHKIKGLTPWEDAQEKVNALNLNGNERVLDICTGLGYTAIHAKKKGCEVITVEKDRNVIEFAEYNPWSRDLEKIEIYITDALEFLTTLEKESFDVVIHDPPREGVARELYSRPFYQKIHSLLSYGGKLIHYVGRPQKRSRNIKKEVSKRLMDVGFKKIVFLDKIDCILTKK